MSTTAKALHSKHLGQPIVVIGGGPSAPAAWASLPDYVKANAVVIFANGHGFKLGLKPDYIVCKDDVHSETKEKMEPQLRAHGPYPIISRFEWADYNMSGIPAQGNSGQLAIAIAALMGGAPIIPIGIDGYGTDGTYFHDLAAVTCSNGRRESVWRSSMTRMSLRLEGAAIRSISGILTFMFPRFNPAERFETPVIPAVFRDYHC